MFLMTPHGARSDRRRRDAAAYCGSPLEATDSDAFSSNRLAAHRVKRLTGSLQQQGFAVDAQAHPNKA